MFDFVQILNIIIVNSQKYNSLYNFGASNKVKIIDLAKKIIKYTNSSSKLKFINKKWDNFSKRKSNNRKLRNEFKNLKFTSIDEGLKKTIEWFKSNNS